MSETITLTHSELREVIKKAVDEALSTVRDRIILNEWGGNLENNMRESQRILGFLIKLYKNFPIVSQTENYKVYSGSTVIDVFNTKVTLNFRVVIYKSLDDYNNYHLLDNTVIKNYFIEPNILSLGVVFIGEHLLYNQALDDIGHELNHLYNYIRLKEGEKNDTNKQFDPKNIYNYAVNKMKENATDTLIYKVCYLIYMSVRSEQYSNLNGAYTNMCMSKFPPEIAFGVSDAFVIQKQMNTAYKDFKEMRFTSEMVSIITDLKQKFGVTYNSLNRFIYARKKEFDKKLVELKNKYRIWWNKNMK